MRAARRIASRIGRWQSQRLLDWAMAAALGYGLAWLAAQRF